MLYNNLSEYFRGKYGKRLGKICIDGGFTCPNRDGKCGVGGCIYCGERGAGEHIDAKASIREQVERGLDGAMDDELFVAYFQNFTNTYADVETLKERYDSALIDERVRGWGGCLHQRPIPCTASGRTGCSRPAGGQNRQGQER